MADLAELENLRVLGYVDSIPTDAGAPKWMATKQGIDSIAGDKSLATPTKESNEVDPTGISAHDAGAKLDAGKNRMGLVLGGFAQALQAVSEVGTLGANKYSDNGWMSVTDGQNRYTDAMMRHLFKELAGEVIDPDLGVQHAAQVAWNALARLELLLRGDK
jgi:hypothetical protein